MLCGEDLVGLSGEGVSLARRPEIWPPGRFKTNCVKYEFRLLARSSTTIDEMTQSNLRVASDGTAGPYLIVPVGQLDAVLVVLDRHKVRYWVDADAISLDNEPAINVINFGRSGDAARIQAILDEAGDYGLLHIAARCHRGDGWCSVCDCVRSETASTCWRPSSSWSGRSARAHSRRRAFCPDECGVLCPWPLILHGQSLGWWSVRSGLRRHAHRRSANRKGQIVLRGQRRQDRAAGRVLARAV